MSNTDADPVARMHALFSDARRTEFGLMESLRAKYKKTSRDIVLADAIDALLATAVQREDLNAPPSFDNRARGSGLAIVGPTGVGKSRALERYFDKHPVLSDYRDPVSPSPLISVSAPSPCTSMTLARLILRTSGYPIERDLPAHRLWEMVWERLANLRKFILHIDELQHAVQYVPEKDRQEIANILKHAMYGRRISLIVSGVDALRAFLDFDPQLLRRLTVLPFGPITPDTLGNVVRMVGDYAKAAGLELDLNDDPIRPDFHLRLAHAALNAFGYSIVVTQLAIEHALNEKATALTREHFATVFARKTGFAADRNPFIAPQWQEIDCAALFPKAEIPAPPAPASRRKAK